jgi:hypothetical protein
MILDTNLQFANDLALPTSTGTANIGSVVDMNENGRFGDGKTSYLCIQVSEAVTSGGSAQVRFQLVSSDNETIETNGDQNTHITSGEISKADLTVGHQVVIPIPGGEDFGRYVGVQSIVGTAALTAGKVNAFVTLDPPASWYPAKDADN